MRPSEILALTKKDMSRRWRHFSRVGRSWSQLPELEYQLRQESAMGQSSWINAGFNGPTSSCPDSGSGIFDYLAAAKLFKTATDTLGLNGMAMHQTRHIGASIQCTVSELCKKCRKVSGRLSALSQETTTAVVWRPTTTLFRAPLRNVCVESDWPSNQTFSEQRGRGSIWSSSKVSTRVKVVTENKWEMEQQEGDE